MKLTRRAVTLILAFMLVLSLIPPVPVAHATGTTTRITLDGFYDYSEANDLLKEINALRAQAGREPVKMEQSLTASAQQRAVEYYIYPGQIRPDGTPAKTALAEAWEPGFVQELTYRGAGGIADALSEWQQELLVSAEVRSVGIASFCQSGGQDAIVLILHSGECETEDTRKGKFPTYNLVVDALPKNLFAKVEYPMFDPSVCLGEVYFYDEMVIGTKFYLTVMSDPGGKIVVNSCDYTYTSSNPEVLSVDNEDHTFHTHQVEERGTTTLGVQIGGVDVPFIANAKRLVVLPSPELTYEIEEDGTIMVDCSQFITHSLGALNLYCYSNKENRGEDSPMWRVIPVSSYGVIRDSSIRSGDTVLYVMRYYDKGLERFVEVGSRLIIQLGDEETTAPGPNDVWDPMQGVPTLRLPTLSELPVQESEPELEQAHRRLIELKEQYPLLTQYSADLEYAWAAGDCALEDGTTFGRETGNACMPMVLSDLIFGDLPARAVCDVTVDSLRYGDLVFLENGNWGIVTAVAADYVVLGVCRDDSYGKVSSCTFAWKNLMSAADLKQQACYALTRYESPAPGADVVNPDIIPEGTVILEQDTVTLNESFLATWAFAEDGTLYIYGYGHTGGGVGLKEPWEHLKSRIRRLVVGQDIYMIGSDDYEGCSALEEVILGDRVQEIGDDAFWGCKALRSVRFGADLKCIGESAFQNCTALERVILPEGLKTVEERAFYGCSGLTELSLPGTLTGLGGNAFTGTHSLEEVTLPGSLTELGSNMFYESGIRALTICEGIQRIGYNCFYRCDRLETVELPQSLTYVDQGAFGDCDAVIEVTYNGTRAQWEQIEIHDYSDTLNLRFSDATFHFTDETVCRHHNTTVVPGYPAECQKPGETDGLVCADCGAEVERQKYIDPLGHDNEISYIEATCDEPGYRVEVCRRCGEKRERFLEEPLGHEYVDRVCIRCGDGGAPMESPFTDVPEGEWYFDPVQWAVANGVTSGTSATTFSPEDTCTRAQVVTFLWRAVGKPEPVSDKNPFIDVPADAYYYDAVLWAVENGVTSGTGGGRFSPDDPCTRAQVVTFLWRAMGKAAPESSDNPFGDVKKDDYFFEPVLWAVEHKITAGTGVGKFSPEDSCTRGQVVTFLYRAQKDQ